MSIHQQVRAYSHRLSLIVMAVYFIITGCHAKQKPFENIAATAQRRALVNKYPKIPHDEILQQIAGNRLYSELEERYRTSLSALKTATDKDWAHLVVIIMTPEVGKSSSLSNTYGIPYIIQSCNQLGIDCINLSADIAAAEDTGPAQLPEEGSWSKAGATSLADMLQNALARYNDYRSSKVFPAVNKPATFGDLQPKDDEIVDGEKNQQYRLTVNAQGLRMNHTLTFPKTKQTILFLGGSQLYSPYLDNNFIATSVLQQRHPDKEIINAGNLNYTMEDFVSLYQDKARYTEPDLVFVCTNGDDILNFYFSQRNKYSRSIRKYDPSPEELQFYEQTFN